MALPPPTDLTAGAHVGPDVDLRTARPRRRRGGDARVLLVIAAGGALGAAARFALSQAWPTTPGGFPSVTLAVNVIGCALIGVVLVLSGEVWTRHRMLRPFLGTGVLGGFTTFSTYTVDIAELVDGGRVGTAALYLTATLIPALAAVWLSVATTRRLVTRRRQ